MNPSRLAFPVVITLAAAFAPFSHAAINTAQIVAGSLSPGCIQWRERHLLLAVLFLARLHGENLGQSDPFPAAGGGLHLSCARRQPVV
ncbi:exported hypothetical protein [Xenorhabdus nematophila str. Websteri]|nr:exported hypothetical protein [Xenorhabdus nematophila str. Websteri]